MHHSCSKLIVAVLAFSLFACTTTGSDIPLPASTRIQAPKPDVPEKYARFVGKWGPADWDGNLSHILIVEDVDVSGNARTIYAYGEFVGWNVKPAWIRKKGHIVGNELRLDRFGNGAEVNYEYRSDGTLHGTYERQGTVATVVLRKDTTKQP